MKYLRLFLCLLYICLFIAPFSSAALEGSRGADEVLAIGTVAIKHGNLAAAKEDAISEALIKGLEVYLADRLGKQGMVNNFERLATDIIPKAKEIIESYHILSEYQVDEFYKILVQLRINKKVIDDRFREVGLIFGDLPQISVLFLVSEMNGDEVSYWWKDPSVQGAFTPTELALIHVFERRGMNPISRRMSFSEDEYTIDMLSAKLQVDSVLKWGELYSADIVVWGQAEISNESDEVSVELDVLDVIEGGSIYRGAEIDRILESDDGREPILGTLERVINGMAVKLIPRIIQYADADQDKVHYLDVTLTGLTTHRQFGMFSNFLELGVSGVNSVIQTRISGKAITMMVEFQGDRNRFIDHVINHENLPFPLTFQSTGKDGIIFKIKNAEQDYRQMLGDVQDTSQEAVEYSTGVPVF